MAIIGVNGGVGSNYAAYYISKAKSGNISEPSNKSANQTSSTNTAKSVGSTKDSNVTISTVELKTSTGGTTSAQGVPTTVSVSNAFLK